MGKTKGAVIPEGFAAAGKNVAIKVEGSLLLIAVDLNGDQGRSASGKTTVIGTTSGNLAVPGAANGAVLGLNVYRK
jgi:hypothetical protein